MKLEIYTADKNEELLLKSLLNAYLQELRMYRQIPVGATTASEYPYLQLYWSEAGRYPFLLKVSGELAGFALVRQVAEKPKPCMSMAEFYVSPSKRRQGVGWEAVQRLFHQFPGAWELQVIKGNQPAMEFWRRCIQFSASTWQVESILAQDGPRLFYHFEILPSS